MFSLQIRSIVATAGAIALTAGSIEGARGATGPTIVTPASVAWTAGTGAEAGTMTAVLAGNPAKSGPYTVRLKLPAGTRFGPHMHGGIERVTVISGAIFVGLGDTMDVGHMKRLPAGSFASIPAGLHHYAMAKEPTVIQIEGAGPDTTTMLGMKK